MVKSDVSAQYKTKECKKYAQTGYCPYGQRCQFIHGPKDQPVQQASQAPQTQKDQSQVVSLTTLLESSSSTSD